MSVMTSDCYDVVIAGGGINGVGVAQAAAAAGYKTLLLEKNPQAGLETSSRSSKLIHGGLRYLETLQFSLVQESLSERSLLLKLAPELVKLQTFNIPLYKNTSRSSITLHAGLSLYALLSGLKNHSFYRYFHSGRWPELDGLSTSGLKAVFQYQDAQTNDLELTLAVLASAIKLGAESRCSSEVVHADIHKNGVAINYQQDGVDKLIHSRVLVNATGPWVQTFNNTVTPHSKMLQPELIQGTHLIMKTSIRQAYYMEAPQDKRAVFLLPWKNGALLGTTENLYQGDPGKVHPLDSERDYLLEVYEHYFPAHDKTILGAMTGCRVLAATRKKAFTRSREIVLSVDDRTQPRVLSMIGGKLTVYRQTAQKVLQQLKPSLPDKKALADTATLTLEPAR